MRRGVTFAVAIPRDLSREERERLDAAGLEAAYIGRELPVADAIPVIEVPAESEREAVARVTDVLGLSVRDSERLVVHRR
jgi:uncharacterized protein YciW